MNKLSLEDFIKSSYNNAYIKFGPLSSYVRKTYRYIDGKKLHVLDRANTTNKSKSRYSNIEIKNNPKSTGWYKKFDDHMHDMARQYGFDGVYVESVLNDFLPIKLKQYGYKAIDTIPPSFFKYSNKIESALVTEQMCRDIFNRDVKKSGLSKDKYIAKLYRDQEIKMNRLIGLDAVLAAFSDPQPVVPQSNGIRQTGSHRDNLTAKPQNSSRVKLNSEHDKSKKIHNQDERSVEKQLTQFGNIEPDAVSNDIVKPSEQGIDEMKLQPGTMSSIPSQHPNMVVKKPTLAALQVLAITDPIGGEDTMTVNDVTDPLDKFDTLSDTDRINHNSGWYGDGDTDWTLHDLAEGENQFGHLGYTAVANSKKVLSDYSEYYADDFEPVKP